METFTREDYLFAMEFNLKLLENELKDPRINFQETNKKLSDLRQKYKKVFDNKHMKIYSLIRTLEKHSGHSINERLIANHFYLNKKHDETVHLQVLNKYSKCAAIAPVGSEDFALAISNRSQLLLHLKKYQNCIIDIDYALSITKSINLRSKLLCRKVKCLLVMNKENEAKKVSDEASKAIENINKEDEKLKTNLSKELQDLFGKKYGVYKKIEKKGEVLDLKNSDKLPYISEKVSFKYNSQFGKHLVANRDIATGEILLVEKPYCIYPDYHQLYIICSYCLKFTFNSIPCKNCVFAVYCSNECQKFASEEYHDIECLINSLLFLPLTIYTRINVFYSRLFIKLIKEFGVKKIIEQAQILDTTKDERDKIFAENPESIIKNYNVFQIFYGLLDPFIRKSVVADETFPRFFLDTVNKGNYFNDLSFENVSILNKIFVNLILKTQYTYELHTAEFNDNPQEARVETVRNNGQSLVQLPCLINHNCYYNTARFSINGSKFVVFASRPIKNKEQLYVNFASGIEYPKEERMIGLHPYAIECNCLACVYNWPAANGDEFLKITEELCRHDPKIIEIIQGYSESKRFNKNIEPWDYDKKDIKQLCDVIDKSYSTHSTFCGATALIPVLQTLNVYFYIAYNDYFGISNNC